MIDIKQFKSACFVGTVIDLIFSHNFNVDLKIKKIIIYFKLV